jgi:hypothetical protein
MMGMLVVPVQTSMAYVDGFKYQLSEDIQFIIESIADYGPIETEWISVDNKGILTLKRGFATDGASGPTFDTGSSMRGAFLHDALYYLMRNGHIPREYRETADKIIKVLCIMDGMYGWRAKLWYKFLRAFGHKNVLASHRREVKYAP